MLEFSLNPRSGVPTYVQLVQQVRHAIRMGELNAGDQLPTVKEVAGRLAINPNTVLKAYRDLERQGLAEPRPGQGTFICGHLAALPPAELRRVQARMNDLVSQARRSGLGDEEISAIFQASISNVTSLEESA